MFSDSVIMSPFTHPSLTVKLLSKEAELLILTFQKFFFLYLFIYRKQHSF